MTDAGANLALVLEAWAEMVCGGSTESLGALLDESVTWQGILPELVCRNRQQVLSLLARRRARPPRLTRIEAAEFGDRVVVSVDGPDFTALDAAGASGPQSLVFTFRDGHVVYMKSEPTQDAAFALSQQPA
jgi:hypothetical protein